MLLVNLKNTFPGPKYIYTTVSLVFLRFEHVKINLFKHGIVNVEGSTF